jgi:hypothetical protein
VKKFIVKIPNGQTATIEADYFSVGSFHNATFYRFENGVAVATHYFWSVETIEQEKVEVAP